MKKRNVKKEKIWRKKKERNEKKKRLVKKEKNWKKKRKEKEMI